MISFANVPICEYLCHKNRSLYLLRNMELSVVVSVFNEEASLNEFYTVAKSVLEKMELDYEILFVNDGSTDRSSAIIDDLVKADQRVKTVRFSRNFGHEAAMIAGIDAAIGDAIVCMDADLQHPPVHIPAMYEQFKTEQSDIVHMVRSNVKDAWGARLFYRLINRLSDLQLEPHASDFFLISKRIADILRNNYRERVRFVRGYLQIIGFSKSLIPYEVPARFAGKSHYSTRKLISLSILAIATLSKAPLKTGIYLGAISALFSLLVMIYSIAMWFIDKPVSGYTTIIVFLGFMFSVQFFILGIIGQYIGFLFDEQKNRPIYIVEE